MIPQPTARNNNLTGITEAFDALKTSATPLVHLLQSTSFIEGNKIALPQLVHRVLQKSWSQMTRKERAAHVGKEICSTLAKRFDYAVLFAKSTLDLLVSTIKAIAATLLATFMTSQEPAKHWRHVGVAIFTVFNSIFGLITPTLANRTQLFFSVTLLGITGRNIEEKINNLIRELQNRWQQAQDPALVR